MKNKRIVDSWNKIEPDSAAETRMLNAILARNHSGQSEKEKVSTMTKIFNWKRLAPIAACFVLVFALVAVIGNNAGWFGGKTLVADLGGGNTLSFYKSGAVGGEAKFVWDVDWGDAIRRNFTPDERETLFGGLGVTDDPATFRSTDGAFMHFEGKIGNTRIFLSANGHPLTDTPAGGNEEISEIGGVPVIAGYFITKANSQGIKNILYFASFALGDISVYVEIGGEEKNSETLCNEITSVIGQLIQNGTPALDQITE